MTTAIISYEPTTIIPTQADTDNQLIALWLHGRPAGTQRQYLAAYTSLAALMVKPLQAVGLADLQRFVDSLAALGANSRKRVIACVKSLFTFGQKLGYLQFNVAAAIKLPKVKDELAARILSEDEVLSMIHKTEKQRDNVLLR